MNSRELSAPAGSAAGADEQHIDDIAQAVQQLLAGQAHGRLRRRLADWPQVIDDADDLCQLAALAFVTAYQRGRIAPDAEAGVHTTRSVAAYAWGICNRLFSSAVRRSKPRAGELFVSDGGAAIPGRDEEAGKNARPTGSLYGYDLLDELLGPAADDEARLWEVLSAVEQRCRAEDVVVTYLLASGVTPGELRRLLRVSVNTPQNALRRVGRELRGLIGLEDHA